MQNAKKSPPLQLAKSKGTFTVQQDSSGVADLERSRIGGGGGGDKPRLITSRLKNGPVRNS